MTKCSKELSTSLHGTKSGVFLHRRLIFDELDQGIEEKTATFMEELFGNRQNKRFR